MEYLNYQMATPVRRPVFVNESNLELSTEILVDKTTYQDVDALQVFLAPHGLEVFATRRVLDVFVIEDQ